MVRYKGFRLDGIIIVLISLFLVVAVLRLPPEPDRAVFVGHAVNTAFPQFGTLSAGLSMSSEVLFANSDVQRSVPFTVSDDVIYRIAYVSINGSNWIAINLSGNHVNDRWIRSTATGITNIAKQRISVGVSDENYIIFYSCTRTLGIWDCHDKQWQIKQFRTNHAQNSSSVMNSTIEAGDYFVAPWGNDSWPGNFTHPWRTWSKAFHTAQAGDLVYFRGGTYYTEVTNGRGIVYDSEQGLGNDGTSESPIRYFNYPGEEPLLDCSNALVDDNSVFHRGISFYNLDYVHIKGLKLKSVHEDTEGNEYNGQKDVCYGVELMYNNHITLENMEVYDIHGIGFNLGHDYYAEIINCDAHDNIDIYSDLPGDYGMGFECGASRNFTEGYTYLYGCRAWNNSDQGFSSPTYARVTFDNCWAFNNGDPAYPSGDGHGWKIGYWYPPQTVHNITVIIRNSIAASNKREGMAGNEHNFANTSPYHLYNNFIYDNGRFGLAINNVSDTMVNQLKRTVRNTISYSNNFYSGGVPIDVTRSGLYTHSNNDWDSSPSITVNDDDFVSLDVSQLMRPRKANGSLPDITFGKLVGGSDLIDKGVDVGLPYSGSAPDLGAFEYTGVSSNVSSGESRYLVRDGVGLSDIVVSSSSSNMVKLAASYFQMYIFNMTNVRLPISNSPNLSYNFHVYIGQSTYTDALGVDDTGCENGGFKMVSDDNYLVMLGNDKPFPNPTGNSLNTAYNIAEGDEKGSMNAVHSFLYDQGMRWYAPISIGTVIPEKQDVAFQDVDKLVNPDFAMRGPYIYYKTFGHLRTGLYPDYNIYLQWQLAQGFNSVEEFVTGSFVHGIRDVIANATMMTEHPEYYAIWDGVIKNTGWDVAPDLCSQGLFDTNVQHVKHLINIHNATMVSVMPTDGFTRASNSSPECLARETPEREFEGQISDYTFEYVNNVAWEIYDEYGVDRKILCAAYGAYLLPPEHLSKPLAPNLQIILTKWRSDNADEDTKAFYNGLTDQWLEFFTSNNYLTNNTETNKFYTYDYYLINRWQSTTQAVPAYFPHIIDEDLKFLEGKSEGEFMEIYSNWPDYNLQWDSFAATALNLYITGKIYWNVSQDVDALLDEYYTLYYGPARDEIKALVEYSEANYVRSRDNPLILKTLRQMAKDALDVAGKDTVEGKRVLELLKLINSSYIGEATLINSCQNLTSASTVYRLTNDVSAAGTCFFIDADDVTLDCQGHTITYSTSGMRSDDHGIYINANWHTSRGDFFNISNCIIRDGSYAIGNITGSAIYNSEADLGVIERTWINTSGAGIIVFGAVMNLYKDNIVYANTGDAFFVQYGGWQGSDIISTNRFENNIFSSVSGQGAYIYRPNNDTIRNNTFSSISNNGLNLFASVNCTLANNFMSSKTRTGLYNYQPVNLTSINNTVING